MLIIYCLLGMSAEGTKLRLSEYASEIFKRSNAPAGRMAFFRTYRLLFWGIIYAIPPTMAYLATKQNPTTPFVYYTASLPDSSTQQKFNSFFQ